jgi:transposase InsO family protein
MLTKPTDNSPLHCVHEIWYWNGLIYVPPQVADEVISKHHDNPTQGHQGIDRTLEKVSRNYYIPRARKKIEQYIKKCDTCQRTKKPKHRPYGPMQPIAAPTEPWEEIAMDFIVKLPKSQDIVTGTKYDSILVVADRLTKYAYLIPWKEASGASQVARKLIQTVFCNHRIPKKIITDRAPMFMGSFWQTITSQLGIKHSPTTAYHPQANGQVERLNQTLETYLRAYVSNQQDNWVELLPIAQIALNDAASEATGISPYYANYGQHRKTGIHTLPTQSKNETAQERADKLKQLHQQLKNDIDFMNIRRKNYYDNRRQETPPLKEGDNAYLIRQNVKTKRPSDKLDFTKLGPFKVKRKLSDLNYELSLPKKMRIHPIFHISLLEPTENPENAQQPEIEPDNEFKVERILDKRVRNGKTEYLVKWEGYPDEENTWEPTNHLRKVRQILREFEQERHPSQKNHPTATR